MFVNTVIEFLIIAFVIFIIVKQVNRLHEAGRSSAPTTKDARSAAPRFRWRAKRCPACTVVLAA